MNTSDWIAIGGVVVSVISALIAAGSLWFTHEQWQKVKNKIAMIDDPEKASEVLPAWYTSRMMRDNWLFGLLMTDGSIIAVNQIKRLSDDGKWMDLELAVKGEYIEFDNDDNYIYAAAEDRRTASIRVDHVVCALELMTS